MCVPCIVHSTHLDMGADLRVKVLSIIRETPCLQAVGVLLNTGIPHHNSWRDGAGSDVKRRDRSRYELIVESYKGDCRGGELAAQSLAMARRSKELLQLIHAISGELHSEDVRGIRFLRGLTNGAGRCCGCGDSAQGLDILESLLDQGCYSQYHLQPLVEVLEEVGRNDLAEKCKEFRPPRSLPLLAAGKQVFVSHVRWVCDSLCPQVIFSKLRQLWGTLNNLCLMLLLPLTQKRTAGGMRSP